ncbi:MAG: TonB-dependent receptor [Xanthomonadaceae bacterium]|nr:TonB-dependent receptor [Xanthomonadaceae bacterium]MDE1884503.1 TonB-dependent receptor [Xanthomonadaceae bacterium]MDE2084433.1 TonB-dependent receptor [Xanthomonadaceae bacterium]
MSQQSILAFSILLALAGGAQAQDAVTQPTIEVTASRVAETVDASLADVTVITRADIDASNAPDLLEVLRLQAGVDVVRTGGAGEQTNVFLRGTNSNHVLVLIDGVRVASSNTGAFAWENLPLDAVQRIEIVRGPRASYWGSDAIGGVIQIFTRRLTGPHIAASYGSYRSADGSAGFGARDENGGFSVQVGARHVGGFSATNPGICNGPNDAYCIYNPDDNGAQYHGGTLSGDYRLGAQTLSASLFRSEGTQNFDNGASDGISHTLDQAIGAALEGDVNAAWHQRFALGTSREDIDTPAFADAYRSTRGQASWTNDVTLSATQHLIAGADAVHERGISIDTSGFGAPYEKARDIAGAFAGWRVSDGAFDSELAARYDHNSQFGGAFSGSAAAGWRIADALRLTASFGTAFRAPDLNELYSPGYGGDYAGNPALKPERSRTLEIGAEWTPDVANRLALHAFSTRVHDLIDFSGGSTYQAINVDRAAIDGMELTHAWRSGAWALTDSVTVQNPRNADSGAQLLRRPKHKLSSLLERAFGARLSAGVEFLADGPRQDVGGASLPGYALLNLRADYRLNAAWRVGARLENLFDRDYVLAHGYNTPGRAGYLTVTWQP